MARLQAGERTDISQRIYRLLRRNYHGLREQEIAQMLTLHRRRTNNYLRELQQQGRAEREGRLWFSK